MTNDLPARMCAVIHSFTFLWDTTCVCLSLLRSQISLREPTCLNGHLVRVQTFEWRPKQHRSLVLMISIIVCRVTCWIHVLPRATQQTRWQTDYDRCFQQTKQNPVSNWTEKLNSSHHHEEDFVSKYIIFLKQPTKNGTKQNSWV